MAGTAVLGRLTWQAADVADVVVETPVVRPRGDRVRTLRLVAVLGRESNVHVLPGAMAAPAVDVENERARARCLFDDVGDLGDTPCQSPQYRCSRHGSP